MAKRPNTPPPPAPPVRREYDGMKIPYVPPEERARFGSDNPGFDPFKLIIAIMIVLFVAYAIYKS